MSEFDLVAILRAQLDDEVNDADRIHVDDCASLPQIRSHDDTYHGTGDDPGPCDCGEPDRVLRNVETKREIVRWCVEVIGDRDLSRYGEVGALADDPDALAVTLAVETLRLLAPRPG